METVVPESFDSLDIAALEALESELTAEFDRKYDGDEDVPLAELTGIADALKAVRAEITDRKGKAEQEKADRDALAEAVRSAPDAAADDAPAAEETAEVAEETFIEVEVETAEAEQPEPVAASAKRKAPPAAALASREVQAPAQPSTEVVITAAADIPGVPVGSTLDRKTLANAYIKRARGLADHSPRIGVASVDTGVPAEFQIGERDDADEIIKAAVDSVLAGKDAQALVASGGWCAPSENMYDLFSIEGRDGLIDLPTVGITRGGVNVPDYIGLDAVSGALWTWTEGNDAGGAQAVTDLDVLTNVATVTVTGHGYSTGQQVQINGTGNADIDGNVFTITVSDANTFTFPVTTGDATNLTGTSQVVKGCLQVPCPSFTDYRLLADGLCITAGNLIDRAYPEAVARTIDLSMTAHVHKVSTGTIADIVARSTGVTVTAVPSDAAGDLLSAIDLQVADYRSQYTMSMNVVLDAVFPAHVLGMVRSTLAMRAGVASTNVSDAEIIAHFTARNLRPQFTLDYEPLFSVSAAVAWPTSVKFLMYPAGGFVKGDGGAIDLGIVRDSVLNATNDFTAAWSEQFRTTIQRGPNAREVTVTMNVDGQTGGPQFVGA
jgi:hypothetical protein